MKNIYLFGDGGHALSCIDVIEKQNKFKIKKIFSKKNSLKKKILNYSTIEENNKKLKKLTGTNYGLVSVGQIKTPKLRVKIYTKMKKKGFLPAVVISPNAVIYKDTKVGEGTIIMNGVIINPKVRIGKNCIINTGCIIEHEVTIEDHCHVSTGSILNGGVIVKKGSFVGSGSVIMQKVIISSNSVIPMGSIIKKNYSK